MKNNQELNQSRKEGLRVERQNGEEKRSSESSGENMGRWTEREKAMYIAFLEIYKNRCRNLETQKYNSIFKKMASFIKTRTPLQCRSHHQKLEAKFRYPNRIISDYKTHSDLSLYHAFKEQVAENLHVESPLPVQVQPRTLTQEVDVQTDLMGLNINYIYQPESRSTNLSQSGYCQGLVGGMGVEMREQQQVKTEDSMRSGPIFYFPFNPHF